MTSRFAAAVRAYRLDAGMTQQELAQRSGVSVAALRDLEQGRRSHPRPATVCALSQALGLNPPRAADLARAATVSRQRHEGHGSDLSPVGLRWTAVPDDGLWLAVLGPLEGWRDGVLLSFGPPARRAVLGVLAANSGVLVRRDTIIDMLWGHAPPDTADDLVRAHVSKLRTLLTPTGRDASARDSRIASTRRRSP